MIAAAALALMLAVAGGATAYLTSNHHGAHPATRAAHPSAARNPTAALAAATSSAAPTSGGPAFSASAARRDIVGLLDTYQSAYSDRSTASLARILSPSVTRHGLAASGCAVSHGLQAVLGDYQTQFQVGTGTYRLNGLSEQTIVFEGTTAARISARYRITPGGSGFVKFKFGEAGRGWKISEIYAACS